MKGSKFEPSQAGVLNDMIYGSKVKDSNVSIREKAEQ